MGGRGREDLTEIGSDQTQGVAALHVFSAEPSFDERAGPLGREGIGAAAYFEGSFFDLALEFDARQGVRRTSGHEIRADREDQA